jgi:hypothetical protein
MTQLGCDWKIEVVGLFLFIEIGKDHYLFFSLTDLLKEIFIITQSSV